MSEDNLTIRVTFEQGNKIITADSKEITVLQLAYAKDRTQVIRGFTRDLLDKCTGAAEEILKKSFG